MITAVNIAAAALLMQFAIGCILSVCAFILRTGEEAKPFFEERLFGALPWIVLFFSFLTIGSLVFSDPYSSLWKPLFGNLSAPAMQSSEALQLVFLADIVAVFTLSWLTGGAASPFIPVFFILPALAIFLRESFGRVTLYLLLISALFTVGIFRHAFVSLGVPRGASRRHLFAYWFVSIASFVLATVVGYITRPH